MSSKQTFDLQSVWVKFKLFFAFFHFELELFDLGMLDSNNN